MNKYNGIIISLIAGLSTLLGYFSVYIKGNKEKIIGNSLSFSAGVMIMLSIIDLLPSSIDNFSYNYNLTISIIYSFIFFILGYIISKFFNTKIKTKNELYNVGLSTMLGIIIHNLPEGIVTYILSTINLKLGILFSIAIILHNIPEGIGISIPIYYSTKSKKKAFLYTFISGISEPLGAILSMIILYKYVNNFILGILLSIISGLMIYISFNELIKISKKYIKKYKYIYFGMIFILIVELLLKK